MPVAEQTGQRKKSSKRIAKSNTKDTVFTKLFKDYDNLLLLYKALHPEDTELTIKNIIHEVQNENSQKITGQNSLEAI